MILEHHAGCAHHPSKHASQPAETGKIHDAEVPVRSAIDGLSAVIGRLRKKGRAPWARAPWSYAVWPAVKRGPLCTDPDLLLAFFQRHAFDFFCCSATLPNSPSCAWVAWFKVCWAPGANHLLVSAVTARLPLQYLPHPPISSCRSGIVYNHAGLACLCPARKPLSYPMRRSQIPRHKFFNGWGARRDQLFSWRD